MAGLTLLRAIALAMLIAGIAVQAPALAVTSSKTASKTAKRKPASKAAATTKKAANKAVTPRGRYSVGKSATRKVTYRRARYTKGPSHVSGGPWLTPTYLDSTIGDITIGEDPAIRRAAVEALGNYNGSVVVVDPKTGRILTMVNQKLALGASFQPCSTVKIYAALAGLQEGVIDGTTTVPLGRGWGLDLTNALAISNNVYFAKLGETLGYETFAKRARELGMGEKAGWNIDGETPGLLSDAAPPPALGGMSMMTSFGEGTAVTPLQLAAVLSAIENGGKLYYLQYPRTPEEIAAFTPKIKRELNLEHAITEIRPGLMGTTLWGTGRRARFESSEALFGKTGTCTDRRTPTHLGWFGGISEQRNLVVVVLLTGGAPVNGPQASEIAGNLLKRLNDSGLEELTQPAAPAEALNEQ